MADLLAGLLSVLLATNQAAAMSNLIAQKTGVSLSIPDLSDPVERQFQKLLADDDAAQAEVDQWIKDFQARGEEVSEVEAATLRLRARERLDQVKRAYEEFLKRHPKHARARLAYGSFLSDLQEEQAAREQWEKARELDPTNPAAWNNLANWYGHNGPVTNAFGYYAKAIELNPAEPTYYENLAITLYMFRRDATNFFQVGEQEIFERSMALYRKALELDPENFILATQYAQSYYGFQPRKSGDPAADRQAERRRFEQAMAAWHQALKLARDDLERQGVYLHFARLQISAGQFQAARTNLDLVTHAMYALTKSNLTKKLLRLESQARATNAAPAATSAQ